MGKPADNNKVQNILFFLFGTRREKLGVTTIWYNMKFVKMGPAY